MKREYTLPVYIENSTALNNEDITLHLLLAPCKWSNGTFPQGSGKWKYSFIKQYTKFQSHGVRNAKWKQYVNLFWYSVLKITDGNHYICSINTITDSYWYIHSFIHLPDRKDSESGNMMWINWTYIPPSFLLQLNNSFKTK